MACVCVAPRRSITTVETPFCVGWQVREIVWCCRDPQRERESVCMPGQVVYFIAKRYSDPLQHLLECQMLKP